MVVPCCAWSPWWRGGGTAGSGSVRGRGGHARAVSAPPLTAAYCSCCTGGPAVLCKFTYATLTRGHMFMVCWHASRSNKEIFMVLKSNFAHPDKLLHEGTFGSLPTLKVDILLTPSENCLFYNNAQTTSIYNTSFGGLRTSSFWVCLLILGIRQRKCHET